MSDASQSITTPAGHVALNRLLVLGLMLRVAVFLLASPFNSDQHLEVIRYIAEHGALPASNVLQQSYHPPLYYLLMTPLALMTSAVWPIHLASCLMSCANLVLIRRLMEDPLLMKLAPGAAFRVAGFALAATLPQFILFGSFISNDPLTQLIGTAIFAALLRYLRGPSTRGVIALVVLVALGLLTKGTFLLTGAAVALIMLRVEWSRRGPRAAVALKAAACAGMLALGSYKYVDNVARLGRPLVHNQEMGFKTGYSRTIWRGPATLYDLDVTKLIRHPVIRPAQPTSYALTLYATFWYAHLGDSSFRGNVSGYELIGRVTYAVAVVPTLLFLLGGGWATVSIPCWLRRAGDAAAERTLLVAAAALFLANLVVVVTAGVRFDVWEAFQGRLLFQSAMPMVVLFLAGASRLPSMRGVRGAILAVCWATVACGVLYLLVEFALARRLLDVDESLLFESQGVPRMTR